MQKLDDYQDVVFRYAMGSFPVRTPENALLFDEAMRYTYELFNFTYPVMVTRFMELYGDISKFDDWIKQLEQNEPRYLQFNPKIRDRSQWEPFIFDTNRYPVPVFGYTEKTVKALDPTWKRCSRM